ncbi:MAG: hypothetical protein WCP86_02115 [bacterium]
MQMARAWKMMIRCALLVALGASTAHAAVTNVYYEDFESWSNGVGIVAQDPTHWTNWTWTGDALVTSTWDANSNATKALDVQGRDINLYFPVRLFDGVTSNSAATDDATHMQISMDVWLVQDDIFDFMISDYQRPPTNFDYCDHPGSGFEISGTGGYGEAGANGFYGAAGPHGNILTFISFGTYLGWGFDYFHKDYDPGVKGGAWHHVLMDMKLDPTSIDASGDMTAYTQWWLDGTNLFANGYPSADRSYTGVPVAGSEGSNVWSGAYSKINASAVWGTGGVQSAEIFGWVGQSNVFVDNISINQGNVDMEVTNIKFNWDTGASTNDAINIRQDYSTSYDISNGEWVKGGTNIPVCYTTNNAVTIRARFTVQPVGITNADIWAVTTGSGGFPDVVKTNVFFTNGVSSPDYVTLQLSRTTTNCIQKDSFVWQWKMENTNETGSSAYDLNTSGVHTAYTILNEPTHPWANIFSANSNVWTRVLDKTCDWANGETTAPGVGGDVVAGIYNSGYEYDTGADDTVGGEPRYYDDITDDFDLTTCLSEWGNTNRDINCWDTANMFTIFSNAGGCDYDLYYITSHFLLNFIRPIGRAWSNDPFTAAGRQRFAVHWTGWSNIYDPCLQVDDDTDPTSAPHTGALPTNMTFNAGTPAAYDDYRGKLVDPADEAGVSGVPVTPYKIK